MEDTKNLLQQKLSRGIESENSTVKQVKEVSESANSKLKNIVNDTLGPLADDYSIKILSATLNEGKTVRELSRELDIPSATCYRRAEELLKASLLETEGITKDERARIYKSNAAKIKVSFKFDNDELKVTITPKEEDEENSTENTQSKPSEPDRLNEEKRKLKKREPHLKTKKERLMEIKEIVEKDEVSQLP